MGIKPARCKTCSNPLILWGKSASGKKRYRCSVCLTTRLYRKKAPLESIIFQLFKQYVLWGNTYEMLSSLSGYSVRYLEKHFHAYLQQPPPLLSLPQNISEEETFLLLDGLWFGRWFVLMVYRQSGNLLIVHIAVAGREVTTKISKDLLYVSSLGYRFTGVVSDGGTGIVGAVQRVFPHVPHQICLAHMHRAVIASLGRYPRDERVKELKRLADHVWLIESKEALQWWQKKTKLWVKENNMFLKEKRYDSEYNWWYLHKGVRRAVGILEELPHTSFHFLNHPLMPKTTNEIEAQFGHVGKRWLAHRGMKRERWEQFLKWFVYFYNQQKISSSKLKEA